MYLNFRNIALRLAAIFLKKGCHNLDRINEKIVKIPESENLDGENPEKDRALIDKKSTRGQKSELGP